MILVFELIQVSIGKSEALSRVPSAEEWQTLYAFAEKQAVVGVCFAGIQKLRQETRRRLWSRKLSFIVSGLMMTFIKKFFSEI